MTFLESDRPQTSNKVRLSQHKNNTCVVKRNNKKFRKGNCCLRGINNHFVTTEYRKLLYEQCKFELNGNKSCCIRITDRDGGNAHLGIPGPCNASGVLLGWFHTTVFYIF